ncbi:hypothetical protein ACIQNU_19225 [Streptomyces sp. NPDC091292]|uniref:hypothetical protein n=1 Tax=Streptomyces sp. NPDC091292 TaxID=3365991 RepID=UPI003821F741
MRSMKNVSARAKVRAAVTALGVSIGLIATATPAHAVTYTTTDNCNVPWINCSYGDLWLLYNSKALAVKDGKYLTSWSSFYGNVNDYWGTSQYQGSTLTTYRYVFNGNGNGSWQYMKNNAASVRNCSDVDNYRVYYNSGYLGHSQYFGHTTAWASCTFVDLDSTLKNNNASQHFA